jgi:hypothetical protein
VDCDLAVGAQPCGQAVGVPTTWLHGLPFNLKLKLKIKIKIKIKIKNKNYNWNFELT